ncbi:TonB family protein [Agrobacterium sp. NPDC089420]|uniref:TonB family protein n=1 Tax=Agrobacterium sp. NPDC089420 TaxID=3363918 RepID=UPI00384E2724
MKISSVMTLILLVFPSMVAAQNSQPRPTNKQEWLEVVKTQMMANLVVPDIPGIGGNFTVKVEITVERDGTISGSKVLETSGVEAIDKTALRMVARTSPVSPLTADMGDDALTVALPVNMTLIAPPEVAHDPETGLTFSISHPMKLAGKLDDPGTETVKYRIISTDEKELPTAPRSPLCDIGFKKNAPNDPMDGWSQERLNDESILNGTVKSYKTAIERSGKDIDDIQIIDMHGAKGIEAVLVPTSGPDYRNVRLYGAFADTPTGRITISCPTMRTAMPHARQVFRRFAESAYISSDDAHADGEKKVQTLEESLRQSGAPKDSGSGQDAQTSANFLPEFKANGTTIHVLSLYKELPDGTPVIAMAFCGVGATEGRFALGVDFGQGMVWKRPEKVRVAFGAYERSQMMQVMREYLGFEGNEAKTAIAQLVRSGGQLTFSGPRSMSVSFDLDRAVTEMAKLRQYCKL